MTGTMRIGGLMLAAAVLASCGQPSDGSSETEPASDASEQPSSPTPEPTPEPVESDACRQDAGEVLDILELALNDKDVRDVAGRLDTVDELLPAAVAQCTSAVSRPVNEAQAELSDAFSAALDGRSDGKSMVRAYQWFNEARAALDATN